MEGGSVFDNLSETNRAKRDLDDGVPALPGP